MIIMIKEILQLGPSIFLPFVIVIIGLLIKMPIKKIIRSALLIGIAFVAMELILDFMFSAIGPLAQKFVENTGIKLSTLDVGWVPVSIMSWSWKFAIFVFPLQIFINFFMLNFNLTNVLNVDILNVWGKIFTAILVQYTTNNIYLAFLSIIIQIILELKIAQASQYRIQKITNIPNITTAHCMLFQMSFMSVVNNMLDKVKYINSSKFDIEELKNKIGIFGENSVMGLIIALILSFFAKYRLKETLSVSINLATSLVLLPLVANLFTDALTPLASYIKDYMKSKYKNKNICIAMDWTFMAGQTEIWVVSIIMIPITILLAIIFSKLNLSTVLPLAGVINIIVVVPAMIITNKNLLKMIIISTIFTPVYLIISTNFSSAITHNLKYNQDITYYCAEAPLFRWSISNIFNGNIIAIIILSLFFMLFYKLVKLLEKER